MPSTANTLEPSFVEPSTVAEALAMAARLEARNDDGYATPVQPYEVRRLIAALRMAVALRPRVGLDTAEVLPPALAEQMGEMAEAVAQAAFAEVAAQLQQRGYPVTGDFSPGEVGAIHAAFAECVSAMALNNGEICALQGGGERG